VRAVDHLCSRKADIREINYTGLNAVTQSDVLDRFKKAKGAALRRSSKMRPKIRVPVVVLKDLLAEHGHQFAR